MKTKLLARLAVLSLAVGCSSATPITSSRAPSEDSGVQAVQTIETDAEPTYDVALIVPTMNCPFACWPKVKETLEHQPGVASVTLAQQGKENVIDNPTVYLSLSGDFSVDTSIAALDDVGFHGAKVKE